MRSRLLLLPLLLALVGCAAPTQVPTTDLADTLAFEATLPLQDGMQSRLLKHLSPAAAKGTLIMYHGFSAGPWQFELLAKKAYDEGYNVYVPRMPGHGLKKPDGTPDPSQLPDGATTYLYEQFGDKTFEQARALGAPISVLGLSVGGNVALYVAEHHPEVQRTVAYAPFLQVKQGAWLLDTASHVDLLFGAGGGTLAMVPWNWGDQCNADMAAGNRPGHCAFSVANVYASNEMGGRVLANAGMISSPVQFFVTGADDAADEGAMRQAYLRSGGASKNGWYYYPKEEGIPHPMVHPIEDKGKGQTPALYDMTMRWLEQGTVSNRGELPQ